MLELKDLHKDFILNNGKKIHALNGVSFQVQQNEVLGIVGESGCGKSTLGRLILRLIKPDSGQIFFNNEEISAVSMGEFRSRRKTMQMIFQNPFASFNPKIRMGRALMELCHYYRMSDEESHAKIGRLLNDTGLSADLLKRWPRELSGGQLQRFAIARALLSGPSLIIADEPLSALDVSVQAQLLNLFGDLRAHRSMMMIFISHDITVVEYFCDRIVVMYMGSIMEIIPAGQLSRALHPYTRSLQACVPQLDDYQQNSSTKQTALISGETPNPQALIQGCPFAPRCPEAQPQCSEFMPQLKEVTTGHTVRCLKIRNEE